MRTLPSWLGLLGTLVLAGLPAPAAAQPVGSEFQVNSHTTGNQLTGSDHLVAADASGNFVVVWSGAGPGDGSGGIFGQRFDSAGATLGSEFRVNSYTTGLQSLPSVASDVSGNFVVVWRGSGQGDPLGIFGQLFDSAGGALGTEFRVNSGTSGTAKEPSIASDASGNFVVVWQVEEGTGYPPDSRVFGQRYDGAGAPLGSQFLVSPPGVRPRAGAPSVASDAIGNFVVVWDSVAAPQYYVFSNIKGQRYDSAGAPLGGAFNVNQSGRWATPSVASDASGNFVVVWSQDGWYQYGHNSEVFGQRYDSEGGKLGTQFRVNTYTTWFQGGPSVASDAVGNFVVAWGGDGPLPNGDYSAVYGRRYKSDGAPQGLEFLINSYTTSYQFSPSVAATGTDAFVVVWTSRTQDGSGDGVFGQRYDFGDGGSTIHVGDLDRRAKNVGASWRAQVKTLTHDDGHSAESGVLVTFNVSGGVGTRTCTTTAGGECEVSVVVADSVPSLTFTVTSLSKTGFGYDAGANHDPDPDSNGTVIVVNQP